MEALRNFSVIWSLLHTLVLFLMLFEPRYPKRKTFVVTISTMIPLILLNLVLAYLVGYENFGMVMLLTLSLPSCIIFWILSKYRAGRFFFTFCIVDTTVLEIVYLTNILNHFLTPNSYLFLFFARLVIYPLLGWWVYKKLRPVYLDVQRHTKKGWALFAIIGALFYVAITLLMNHPTPITERTEYIPVLILLLLLMPVIYLHIISTLRYQQAHYEKAGQDSLLSLQVSNLSSRMEELAAADEKFRMERHNFRHKLKTIASLIKTEQYEECLNLLSEYEEHLDKTRVKRYCQHTVLDAVLSTYIQKAQDKEIDLRMGFAFPDQIPVNETELATAIANALENAINACEKLDPPLRYIDIKVVSHPRFMIRIVNSHNGTIEFDENNIPINHTPNHGFGTRFIASFCKKNNGFYEFKADEKTFTLYLNF